MENFSDDCIDFRQALASSENELASFSTAVGKSGKSLKQFQSNILKIQSSLSGLTTDMQLLPDGIKARGMLSDSEPSEGIENAMESMNASLAAVSSISVALGTFGAKIDEHVMAPTAALSEDLKSLDEAKKRYEKLQQSYENALKKSLQGSGQKGYEKTMLEYELSRFDYRKELYDVSKMLDFNVASVISGMVGTFVDLFERINPSIDEMKERASALDSFRSSAAQSQYDADKEDGKRRHEFSEVVGRGKLLKELGSDGFLEGWLFLRLKKNFKRRWFVLKDNEFYYYGSKLEVEERFQVSGLSIKREPETALNFCFEVTPQGSKDVYFLQATDKETKLAWVNALRKSKEEMQSGDKLEYSDIYKISSKKVDPDTVAAKSPPPPPRPNLDISDSIEVAGSGKPKPAPRPVTSPRMGGNISKPPPKPERPTQQPAAQAQQTPEKKKGARFGRRKRGATTRDDTILDLEPVFGVQIADAIEQNAVLPRVVQDCITQLIKKNAVMEVGIFRLSGSAAKINELKEKYNKRVHVDLESVRDPHAIAGLLKLYLRELPEPLIHPQIQTVIEGIIENMEDGSDRIELIKQQLRRLSLPNRATLQWLLGLLGQVVKNEAKNKMGFQNVAIVFCPTLHLSGKLFKELITNEPSYKE